MSVDLDDARDAITTSIYADDRQTSREVKAGLSALEALCDEVTSLRAALAARGEAAWAISVLDAYAEKHEEVAPPAPVFHRYMSKVDGSPVKQWRVPISTNKSILMQAFSTANGARLAVAQNLVERDPSLHRPLPSPPVAPELGKVER